MNYLIVLAISLLGCAIGFFMYIYFFSVGYGLSIALIGVSLLVAFGVKSSLSVGIILVCALLVLYGLRLGGYLLIRQLKNPNYTKVLSPEIERSKKIPLYVKIMIWLSCGLLYTLMTIPVLFRLNNAYPSDAMLFVGFGVMTVGFLLEFFADAQKNAAKKKNPRRFVDKGLYRIVRCPNYLGEIILWLGVLLTGVTVINAWWQWVLAILGYTLIVYVMISGARRLEIRQDRNYASDPEYQKYIKTVPILFPLIPLYSVKKYKIFSA